MQLYHQPHRSRKKETAFVQALAEHFNIQEVIPRNHPIPENLSGTLSTKDLAATLEANMPTGKRWPMLLAELQRLQEQVRVFITPSQISCDVVIVDESKPHYIEFHERQHRTLSIDRPRTIYDMSGETITVPRYVQRFLRDMWRAQNLRPFTIVWDDYFAAHGLQGISLHEDHLTELHQRIQITSLLSTKQSQI
jgi:hypothetical protein